MNKGLQIILQVVLALIVLVLAWVLVRQIMTPLEFTKESGIRQAAVIERIKDIRSAEQAFKQKHERYTGSWDTLINFVLNDSLVYERQIGSMDDSVAVARGLVRTEKFSKAVRDTIFAPRKLSAQQIREMKIIPYSDPQAEYILRAAMLTTESKVIVPVFEAKAPFKTFMGDMNHQLLVNLIDDAQNVYNRYPGIAVGSIEAATNDAGNWE